MSRKTRRDLQDEAAAGASPDGEHLGVLPPDDGAGDPPEEPGEKPKKKAEKKYEAVKKNDPVYQLLDEVRKESHPNLEHAKIALAWWHDVKPDRDGHVHYGKCKKVGPLDREFIHHDFLILLNAATWSAFPEGTRRALLDHELCHAATKEVEGQVRYYIRRHDIEDFNDVVLRHGMWLQAARAYVAAAQEGEAKHPQLTMFPGKVETA